MTACRAPLDAPHTGVQASDNQIQVSVCLLRYHVCCCQGPDPIGTGLVVSSGPLRGGSLSPIPASEFMLNPCVDARMSFPPPGASHVLLGRFRHM